MTLVRRPIIVLGPVAVLLVLLAMSTNVLPVRQILDQRDEIETTRVHLEELRAENTGLEARVESLDTPVEIERLARDELGYVFPGETAYLVIRPDAEPTAPAAGPASTDVTDVEVDDEDGGRSPLAELWDYLTGRDLADG